MWTVRVGVLPVYTKTTRNWKRSCTGVKRNTKIEKGKREFLVPKLRFFRTFDYFYGLRLGILLLRHSDNLSALRQAKELCAAESQTIANILFLQLRRRRRKKLPSLLGGCETASNTVRCRCTKIA